MTGGKEPAPAAPTAPRPASGDLDTDLGPGVALPAGVAARMAPVVGGGLDDVRVHTGPAASTRAVGAGALAVTVGRDIAFAAGWYRPGTVAGDALLAHELAHARQQEGGGAGGGAPAAALEAEADRAAFAAALRLLDPGRSGGRAPVPLSHGQPLQLRRCAPPTVADIRELPSREEYERRGELLPRAFESLGEAPDPLVDVAGVAGQLTLVLPTEAQKADPTTWEGTGRAPLPPDLGAASPVLDDTRLATRLATMELTQRTIDAAVDDLRPGPQAGLFGGRAQAAIFLAQHRVGATGPAIVLVPPDVPVTELVPGDKADLSREVARSEVVQERVLDALLSLRARREQEIGTSARLPGYDLAGALALIDDVRRAFRDAADAVLTPRAVELCNAAEAAHAKLHRALLAHTLRHFQDRTSKYQEIQPSIRSINDWAWSLQEKLAGLEGELPALLEARQTGSPDLAAMEQRFVRTALLVAVSIEALGEWDLAVQAYEFLRGNTALWGFEGVDAIAWRLGQLKEAAYDEDVDYLQLLLRDHRADPQLQKYYASLPEVVRQSQFLITLAITLVALVAAAGVGIVVGAAASTGMVALGFQAGSQLVLGTAFVAKVGAEALVFTIVSRSLSSLVPGMEPKSSFWWDLMWNFGLFLAMTWATRAVQLRMVAMGASRLATTGAVLGTAYAILQGYGWLRFAAETGRVMTAGEIGRMSVENLIMLVALAAGTAPFRPALARLEHLTTVRYFRTAYGGRFAEVDAARRQLELDVEQRARENPDATRDDVADLEGRARELDEQLRTLVEEVAGDPQVRPEVLREEATALFEDVGSRSLAEVFGELGLDPSIELRPSGEEGAWSIPEGSTARVVAFLEAQGFPVLAETTVGAGRPAVTTSVTGRGRVTFVERGVEPAPGTAAEGGSPGGPGPGGATGPARPPRPRRPAPERTPEETEQIRQIDALRQRVYRWRQANIGNDAIARVYLDQLRSMSRRARTGDDVRGEIAELREALTTIRRAHRPARAEQVERLEARLRRQVERSRDPVVRSRFQDLADRVAALRARMRSEPGFDPRSQLDVIRRQERTAGALDYEVYLPLEDAVTFERVRVWLERETRVLLDYPGGEFLRNEMLDQLHSANVLELRQSPRGAGLDVATTRQMRAAVEQGIRDGRFPPEFVEAFEANRSADGWPRTPDGRPWEIDHVYELWQGGADNIGNYLPIDPRLHRIKTQLLRDFRAEFREPYRVEGEQTEVTGEVE